MNYANKTKIIRSATLVTVFLVLTSMLPNTAYALSGSSFLSGRIIDDSVFYDQGTMSATDIQNFLNAKVPVCDTNGTQPYGGTTRAAYGASRGYPAPYTCLKSYSQSTPSRAPESGLCAGFTAGTKSASRIIFEVGQSCGINPQVLLVLLQKEQSLVTDDWPWSIQYRSATGYGCPDTAACDAQYYGFFNQVYAAARQFKYYTINSTSYSYRAGRNNSILYNPNGSCGSSNVYIENQATANLYIYTPYQPNQAALNNLYGTGDNCSAYGNRNFWRMFNDWFGSTLGSYLVRTTTSDTVYLIADDKKYPVPSLSALNNLSVFGSVTFVSQSYMNSKTTGSQVGRTVKSASSSSVYFMNSGMKLPFLSCEMIAEYGTSCGNETILTDLQIAKLTTGPAMTRLYQTIEGYKYYIHLGKKQEIFDETSKTNAGISGSYNRLSFFGIENLPENLPVIRDNVIAKSRASGYSYYYDNGQFIKLPQDMLSNGMFSSLPKSFLNTASLLQLPIDQSFVGFVSNVSSAKYLLVPSGKVLLPTPSDWASNYITFDDAIVAHAATSQEPVNAKVVKAVNASTIYKVFNKIRHPMPSFEDVLKIQKLTNNIQSYANFYDSTVRSMVQGSTYQSPLTLIKNSTSTTVYMVDTEFMKRPLTSFAITSDLGISSTVRIVSEPTLNEYQTEANIKTLVTCNGKNYVGLKRVFYEVSNTMTTQFGWTSGSYLGLGTISCANLPFTTKQLTNFIRTSNGSIYSVTAGTKRPFTSYEAYINNGGNSTNTVAVSDYFAGTIATGSPINASIL